MNSPFTPGPWVASKDSSGSYIITSPDESRPLFRQTIPERYYTDYPTYRKGDEEWTILSTEAARAAGNYVATPEIRAEIDRQLAANARLAAPELIDVLQQMIDTIIDLYKAVVSDDTLDTKLLAESDPVVCRSRELISRVCGTE